jgi:carbon monoxide dehydrogenase subunit G
MIFEDHFLIEAPRPAVWAYIWDPEKMSRCVPGVEQVVAESDDSYLVRVKTRVGFLSATFNLAVKIMEAEEPVRLMSVFEGKDSKIASRLKQVNTMELVDVSPTRTEIRYKTEVTLMGKLATLGRSVIKGKAKQMMKEFSQKLKAEIEKTEADMAAAKEG